MGRTDPQVCVGGFGGLGAKSGNAPLAAEEGGGKVGAAFMCIGCLLCCLEVLMAGLPPIWLPLGLAFDDSL